MSADKLVIATMEGSENLLQSVGEFVQTDDSNVDAAVFAKCDVTLSGQGVLNVSCHTGHAIVSKDDLKLKSGTVNLEASNKGLVGKDSGLGINSIAGYGWCKSFVVEVILTFVFVLTILGVTSKESYSSVAGIVIGLSLTLVHLLGIRFTGTSVNPARSFGPAVIVGGDQLKGLWVFIVAPLVGGVLAAFCYKFLADKQGK